MGTLIAEVRKMIYTMICFQCVLQLTEGSAYQKYLKLFTHILTLCICCSVIIGFLGQMEESLGQADRLYAEWEKEWYQMMNGDEKHIIQKYDGQWLWEEKIIDEAYREYDSQKEERNVGEDSSAAERDR